MAFGIEVSVKTKPFFYAGKALKPVRRGMVRDFYEFHTGENQVTPSWTMSSFSVYVPGCCGPTTFAFSDASSFGSRPASGVRAP
ncbi:MAG TPA: hypothetical protein PLO51_02645, partial [Candidatus Micrarchaeota archaeon]|nr:hypothetical protein [Candidatus Micrarchaeota archaeon]